MRRKSKSSGSGTGSDDSTAVEVGCCLLEILAGVSCFTVLLFATAIAAGALSLISALVLRPK